MPPGKKRKAASTPTEDEFSSVDELRQKTQDTVTKLGDTLDELEQSDAPTSRSLMDDASLHLLQLKSLQRRLLDEVHKSQEKLLEQRKDRDRQELQLESLKYQKVLNRHAMEKSKNPEISNLVLLCRSELEEGADHDVEDRALIQNFFRADAKDPIQRAVIMDKLNQQLRMRKKLESELGKRQEQASLLRQSFTEKRKLLESLPSRLQDMERASQPLRKFCQKSLNASRAADPDRLVIVEQAHSLPKALYTLFYLLQSALHGMEASGELQQLEKSCSVPSLEVQKVPARVLLTIPIPTISDRAAGPTSTGSGFGGGKKVVSIAFEYDQDSNTIFAASSDDHDMGDLLTEVFPGDTGEDGIEQSNGDSPSNDTPRGNRRPYSWCNYLAGLHLAQSGKASKPDLHKSAAVLIRSLVQRVRAQATLNWILHALSRKPHPIPVHPNMKQASFCQHKDSNVRLVSWNEDTQASDPSKCYFLATLKWRSSTLDLRVGISTSRYPVDPPNWELNPAQDQGSASLRSGETVLYEETLSRLERSIDDDVEKLVDADEETTYEWILAHQLSEIATKWEELMVQNE